MPEAPEWNRGTLGEWLGMEFLELTRERVTVRMPVDARTHQPMGILHGGASAALAETAASVGAWLNVSAEGRSAVGLEINANHIRPVRSGHVIATAEPLHRGRTTHVWQIRIEDEERRLVCVSRCTLAILDRDAGVRPV